MKKFINACLSIILITIVATACIGCTSKGFKQEDFSLEIADFSVEGDTVDVEVIFRNNTYRKASVMSSGAENDVASIIKIECKDENGNPEYDYPAVIVNNVIAPRADVAKRETLRLAPGKYKLVAKVTIFCESWIKGEGRDMLYYESETIEFEIV